MAEPSNQHTDSTRTHSTRTYKSNVQAAARYIISRIVVAATLHLLTPSGSLLRHAPGLPKTILERSRYGASNGVLL